MPHLELESPDDLIRLDGVMQTGEGVEALAGVLGLGLPPVDVQWTIGAGDGARFQSSKVQPRDIDLPLHLLAADRDDLKLLLPRVVKAIRNECILRFVDDTDSWILKVRRIGGGNYAYGTDTTGDRDLTTIITVRAGDPFWKRETSESYDLVDGAGGIVEIDPGGDCPTPPVITLTGPGMGFEAVSPDGERLAWTGALATGESLVIDFEKRTVVDGTGRNRYGELGVAPRFWRMPPGLNEMTFGWDNSSSEFLDLYGETARNYVTNPQFVSGFDGWTHEVIELWDSPYAPYLELTAEPDTGYGPGGWGTAEGSLRIYMRNSANVVEYSTTLTGLEIGREYVAGALVVWNVHDRTKRNSAPYVRVGSKKVSLPLNVARATPIPLTLTFTAEATTQTLVIGSGSAKNNNYSNITWVTNCFTTEADSAEFFTGDNPDTADYLYSWEGVAHKSRSLREPPVSGVPDTSQTNINVSWHPRKEAII